MQSQLYENLQVYIDAVWKRAETNTDPYALFAEDVCIKSPLTSGTGLHVKKENDRLWHVGFSDMRITDYQIFCGESDLGLFATVHWRVAGLHDGMFCSIEPTYNRVAFSGIHFMTIKADQVQASENHINMLDVYAQIGVSLQEYTQCAGYSYQMSMQASKKLADSVGFTRMESLVLSFYTHGWSAKEIGSKFSISFRTVEKHVAQAMKKCGVKRRSGLMDMIYGLGIHHYLRTLFDAELSEEKLQPLGLSPFK